MMINKRLIRMAPESQRHIRNNVIFQLFSLGANIGIIFLLGNLLRRLLAGQLLPAEAAGSVVLVLAGLVLKAICAKKAGYESYLAAKGIKKILREKIYRKLLSLGGSYTEKVSTAEVVQVSVEGVEQLEIYFGSYLPQFFLCDVGTSLSIRSACLPKSVDS